MVLRKCIFLLGIWMCMALGLYAQQQLHIFSTDEPIRVDGILDEAVWEQAEKADSFTQKFPYDTLPARAKTIVKMTYNDRFLYVAAICINPPDKKRYVIQSLRRDFEGSGLDEFGVILDPFDDRTNGFAFSTNPYAVQREALIINGGGGFRNSENVSWDNVWQVKTQRTDDEWTVEMAIPFKSLRFKEGIKEWNVNFYRQEGMDNESSTWFPIPRQFRNNSLAFTGRLIWDEAPSRSGPNIALIPYTIGGLTRDYEDPEQEKGAFVGNIGGDAKIALSSSLNLDLTVNPDFSQVEVDQQVTNLDRFEIFFPERRQFFLENSDLFSDFGSRNSRPFFSRRIGVTIDTATGTNIQNPLYFGARMSGKVNQDWRVGLMSIQAAPDEMQGLESINYSVAAVQRRVFKRSNLAAIVVNKQSFQNETGEITIQPPEFNRVVGLDYNHASANDRWTGKVYYHQSISPDTTKDRFAHGGQLTYRTRNIWATWTHEWVGENYNAETGFVRRTGFKRANPELWVSFYPDGKISKWINQHGPRFELDVLWNDTDGLLDRTSRIGYRISTQKNHFLLVDYALDQIKLTADFDPSRSDGLSLPAGSVYQMHYLRGFYRGNRGALVSSNLRFQAGQYFNGHRYSISGDVNVRMQPYVLLGVNFSLNQVTLPEPYNSATPLLIGPRLDITFSNQLFFTLLAQYNSQFDNLNLNARFQWRFAPVSDLFIVYTDNYGTEEWGPKNRGVVVKLTYWFNI